MKSSDKKPFDYDFYIQRNKEAAMEKYGHRLDKKQKHTRNRLLFR